MKATSQEHKFVRWLLEMRKACPMLTRYTSKLSIQRRLRCACSNDRQRPISESSRGTCRRSSGWDVTCRTQLGLGSER
eukprot:4800986-Pleurochrysis_carterae.AAC.1